MLKLNSFFICILLMNLVVACDGEKIGILFDTSCTAPCWRGIKMGATKEEVINSLGQMSDVEKETITIVRTERAYMDEVIHWKYNDNQNIGNVVLTGGRVAEFYFPLTKDLSLASMERFYGDPQTIVLQKERLDNIFVTIYLFYQLQGICLEVDSFTFPFLDPKNYKMTPSTKVSAVYYVDPTITDWQTKLGCLAGMDINDFNKLAQKWIGYGDYKVYELGMNQ